MTDHFSEISSIESKIITIIRAIAMVLIILCHYCDYFEGVEFLSQLFNVGVPIFFIISGFLYGQKQINNIKKWYIKQFAKIVIPLYIYYFISPVHNIMNQVFILMDLSFRIAQPRKQASFIELGPGRSIDDVVVEHALQILYHLVQEQLVLQDQLFQA